MPVRGENKYNIGDLNGNYKVKHLFVGQIGTNLVIENIKDVMSEYVSDVVDYYLTKNNVYISIKNDAVKNKFEDQITSHIYKVSVTGEDTLTCLTCSVKGSQTMVSVTENEKYIIHFTTTNGQKKNDHKNLVVFDVEKQKVIINSYSLDQHIEDYKIVSESEKSIVLVAKFAQLGELLLEKIDIDFESESISTTQLTTEKSVSKYSPYINNENVCVKAIISSLVKPHEIYDVCNDKIEQVSFVTQFDYGFSEANIVSYIGSHNDRVQALVVLPPTLSETNALMLMVLEETAYNEFMYEHSPLLFASSGYVVALINEHGKKSYGEKFERLNARHFNQYGYDDIMMGISGITEQMKNKNEKLSIDINNVHLYGSGIAGSRIAYILGHSKEDYNVEFKSVISHGCIFTMRSYYYQQYENTFEYDMEGPEYENNYWYKLNDALDGVKNWKVPTLISHGDLDYVVDKTNAISLFTALRRQGIIARYVRFPSEGHHIIKRPNVVFLMKQQLSWVEEEH